MADSRAIGIFDSGLGGLTVAKEIIKYLPCEDIIYFGDTGRVPYGNRSKETIIRYATEDEAFLLKHNVKVIIAACGTVSSVASNTAESLPVPYFEMITHAAEQAVKATKNGKIGAIGTAATIMSGSHKREILKLMPEAEVTACSCSLFVPLVEEGWISEDDSVVFETVKRYLKPILESGCDTLILGCTHYPVLEKVIKKIVGENVALINPGVAVAKAVGEYLINNNIENNTDNISEHKFFVSDKPDSFKNLASVLLGKNIDDNKVEQVNLNDLC